MKRFLIAGNWKMNKLSADAEEFVKDLRAKMLPNEKDVCILAPFTLIAGVGKALEGSGIGFGAQNVHFEESGAYTGEVSVPMLKELGITHCIVGHSERREYFNETDDTVNRKLRALLDAGITPILCVGESLEVREAAGEQTFVAGQLIADFSGIPASDAAKVVIAYEPIWAIGTGKTATAEDANEACGIVRKKIAALYSDDTAEKVRIQYGGSVKPANIQELLSAKHSDGALVGGASLEDESFVKLLEAGSIAENSTSGSVSHLEWLRLPRRNRWKCSCTSA